MTKDSDNPNINLDTIDLEAFMNHMERLKENSIGFTTFERTPVLSHGTDPTLWETSMTNPLNHNSQNFRYLVHALSLPNNSGDLILRIFALEQCISGEGKLVNIDLLGKPFDISKKPIISTSLIDHNKSATFKDAGLILSVHEDNVLRTAYEDIGTNFPGKDALEELNNLRDTEGIGDPEHVLTRSNPYSHNEVVLTGTSKSGHKVQPIGLFVKTLPDGPLDQQLSYELRTMSYRNNLPVIEIPEFFNPYAEKDLDSGEGYFAVSIGGTRYLFGTDNDNYLKLEYGGRRSFPMSAHDREVALNFLQENYDVDEDIEEMVNKASKFPANELNEKVRQIEKYERIKLGLYTRKEISFDIKKHTGPKSKFISKYHIGTHDLSDKLKKDNYDI
tara:strand:- start:15784 stop:16950 length:1167 start_codon:yes stop_codon:yes gene_type:complete